MGPNRVGVPLHSPEDGNRSSFRNVEFSTYLQLRAIDNVQKSRDFGLYFQVSSWVIGRKLITISQYAYTDVSECNSGFGKIVRTLVT
jgi:hypothetical protein